MLFEVDEAATRIREEVDLDANIIVGATFDESLEGVVRVSVVATGIDNLGSAREKQPAERSLNQLAGKLRNDTRRIGDRVEPSAPQPQLQNPSLRPTAPPPEGRQENTRHVVPLVAEPHGRLSAVRSTIEEGVHDVRAFLRRRA